MDTLSLFNQIEKYIAQANYKVEEVENMKATLNPLNGDMLLLSYIISLSKIIEEYEKNLSELAEKIEENNKDDIFFIGHHEGSLRQKLRE